MAKFSLQAQISELKREQAMRELDYPRQIARRSMREAEAEYRLGTLGAAIETLEWLDRNRAAVLAAHAATMPQETSGS